MLNLANTEPDRKGCQWKSAKELLPSSVYCFLLEMSPYLLHGYLVHMMTYMSSNTKGTKIVLAYPAEKLKKEKR